jgi:TATA element modulatory factor
VLRARAEESSTSATSSAQAKLLRQVEMLQTQHTIASQNWQRIEDSLQLRTSSLEKEKIDLTRRFEEEKKKVKEIVSSPILQF